VNGAAGAEVRRATPADDASLVPVLVRAYRDDPIMNYAFRADQQRERAWATFFRLTLDLYHGSGAVFTNESRQGCAMWAPPGKWQVGRWKELQLAPKIFQMLGWRRLGRGLEVMHRMQREHPREPHWYLNLVGVDPPLHGQGVGSALVRAGLALCDRDRLGAYLETSNPRNLPLYQRHGFATLKSFDFGPNTPTFWLMWRPARGAG
jgi:GNAT superfamily N-acetyltransferase